MDLTQHIESRRDAYLQELCEFLKIPSVSTQSAHKGDVERAAKWVADKLRAIGMDSVEIIPTKMHPLVYAESLRAPGKSTILFTATMMCSRLSRSIKLIFDGLSFSLDPNRSRTGFMVLVFVAISGLICGR
jgi:hypothetical protein